MNEPKRLYLKAWEYNAARILTKLADIVEAHGGTVAPGKNLIITDRNNKDEETPIRVSHDTYISYKLGGEYHYYQVNSNPFCEFYYIKKPVLEDNRISKNYYADADSKKWLFDCFFNSNCGESEITEGAHLIFNMLSNAKQSEKYTESTKTRVPNTYDNGYHYENIPKPERFEVLDF